jgi:hypothetical protein
VDLFLRETMFSVPMSSCCRLAAELSSDDEQHFQNKETRRLQADKNALRPVMLGGSWYFGLSYVCVPQPISAGRKLVQATVCLPYAHMIDSVAGAVQAKHLQKGRYQRAAGRQTKVQQCRLVALVGKQSAAMQPPCSSSGRWCCCRCCTPRCLCEWASACRGEQM